MAERHFDVFVRPGYHWELAHFFLAAEAFDSFHKEMGVDTDLLIPARRHLRAMVQDFDWPVDDFPPDERGWQLANEVFLSGELPDAFKSWYYTWFRNIAHSTAAGRRERFLFPSFLLDRPPEIDESTWWRDVIRPDRHESIQLSKQMRLLRGKLDDWIPKPLQESLDPGFLDLTDFGAYTLQQWRLRVAMQEVLSSLNDTEIAWVDARFREFCEIVALVPRPISCVFDRGLRNGAFRAHYGLRA